MNDSAQVRRIHFSHSSVPVNSFKNHALLPNLDLFASLFHHPSEAARQLFAAIRLAPCYGLGRNQFGLYANRLRSREDEISRRLLVDAAPLQSKVFEAVPSAKFINFGSFRLN